MIYLDHHTLPSVDPQIQETCRTMLGADYVPGNATYAPGILAQQAIEQARSIIAEAWGVQDESAVRFLNANAHAEIFACLYLERIVKSGKKRVIISCRESAHAMQEAWRLRRMGVEIVRIGLCEDGSLDTQALAGAIDGDTAWVSLQAVDGQSGAIFGVDEAASFCQLHEVPLHVDVTHAIGKIPFDVQTIGADFVSFESQALFMPAGLSVAYVRNEAHRYVLTQAEECALPYLTPLVRTLAQAFSLTTQVSPMEMIQIKQRRDRFEELIGQLDGVNVLLPQPSRIVHTTVFAISGVSSDISVRLLSQEGFLLAAQSDHERRNPRQTPLIEAVGKPREWRHTVMSASWTHLNFEQDIDAIADIIKRKILPLRYAE